MQLIPYLTLNGNAKEAIAFYEQALGAKVLFKQSYGEMPANPEFPLPPETKDYISFAKLKIGDSEVMISDTSSDHPSQSGSLVSICINSNDAEASKRIFEALEKDGQVVLPYQSTFFSPGYGQVTDKFGVLFQIFTEGSH